jgi:hypothetical protein
MWHRRGVYVRAVANARDERHAGVPALAGQSRWRHPSRHHPEIQQRTADRRRCRRQQPPVGTLGGTTAGIATPIPGHQS